MSDKIKNPPAFPCEQSETQDGSWNQTFESGMSLRDWFAGQALSGLCSNPAMFDGAGTLTQVRAQENWMVEVAYVLANIMLAARNSQED